MANTAVTWPGRLRQIHSFFRSRSPDQMLATAAPWTSPWLPPGYEQNFWNGAGELTRYLPFELVDDVRGYVCMSA